MRARSRLALFGVALSAASAACSLVTDLSALSTGAVLPGDAGVSGGEAASDASGDVRDAGTSGAYRAAVLADKPIAYCRFGEKSGGTASDETGNGHAGTVTSSAVWGLPGALAGDTDTALHVDSQTQILFGPIDFAGTAPFSLEIWFNVANADTTYRFLFDKENTATPREAWAIALEQNNGLYFERFVAGVDVTTGVPAAGILGRWVHTVGVYDGTQLIFYVDGAEAGRKPDARSQLPKDKDLKAPKGSGSGVDGMLDELAIYDHALSADRVKAHFEAAK